MNDDLKVLIVDDEPAARRKLRLFLSLVSGFIVVGEAQNGLEALEFIEKNEPDIVFLDIQMPQMGGIAVASNLEDNPDIRIVFVTAYNEFAVKAFELNAVDYLLKPFDKARFKKSIDRIKDRQKPDFPSMSSVLNDIESQSEYPKQLLFKTNSGLIVTRTDDVEWVESSGNYVKVCLKDDAFIARQTLLALQSQLDPKQFIRIHRSHLVNLLSVAKATALGKGDYTITLHSGVELKLSRSFEEEFFKVFS